MFARLGGLVARRPVLVALVSGAVVVALAGGTLGFRQNYDFVSQLPSDTESRKAFADLQSGFPAGALNPTQVYVRGDQPLDTADLAVEHAGPSVVSAGVIPAGTFGSLLLAGVAFLTQMGVAVTVGIILAAFVISVFLVPAVTALIGHRAWWPGWIDRPLAGHVSDPGQLAEVEPTGNGSARSRSTRL